MSRAYYNEINPFAAAWLRELIKAGLIAPGDVDERSIEDVAPVDLRGFTQCHFFAGIGGWSYALRLARWPDDRPVWTGSCPCQPFSAAGKGAGFDDERHLWPAWYWLIRQCRPGIVFGEQVASKAGLAWLDLVSSDMEGAGYAIGPLDLCAASVGAFHIRQRLWFVADAKRGTAERYGHGMGESQGEVQGEMGEQRLWLDARYGNATGILADAECPEWGQDTERREHEFNGPDARRQEATGGYTMGGEIDNPWRNPEWLPCRDGKARPTQPGLSPLAHGVPARVGRLRGYGNAIVPQVAAEVIKAYMEGRPQNE